jgi:Ser/Thr protein kinase RdoA (MazF antagonist)
MHAAFAPDLFSSPTPGWEPAAASLIAAIEPVVASFSAEWQPLTAAPEQSQALGINSSNLRLHTGRAVLLLKRWSLAVDRAQARRTLELMTWLAGQGLPVPTPLPFRNGDVLHASDAGLWCLFPFVDGGYFSGAGAEIEATATMTARLTQALSRCPTECVPDIGPAHLTDADDDLLARMEHAREQWPVLFDAEHAQLLGETWPFLRDEWRRLRLTKVSAGPVQVGHVDLHPHNWLLRREQVVAILDFEACKVMPVGYALAFAGLKLCRQAVCAGGDPAVAARVGQSFVSSLRDADALLAVSSAQVRDLALAEVLRRLCVIFRLNVERRERTWNKVLPVQLRHLSECHVLFS